MPNDILNFGTAPVIDSYTPSARTGQGIGHNQGPAFFLTAPVLPTRSAIIYKPARSAMTSGRKRTKQWLLRFERCTPLYIEPLMGWTADDDPLANLELKFDSLTAAVRYAKRQQLNYRVEGATFYDMVTRKHS